MSAVRARAARGLILAALVVSTGASAQSGGGYDLSWHTVDGGGATFSTGGGYSLGGTAGQPDAGSRAGGAFTHSSGFWFAAALTSFTVAKDFSDGNPAAVLITLTCSEGVVTPATALASESAPAVFDVSDFIGAPTCTATETVPPGYTANQAGCASVALSTGTCTIVNTLNAGTFVVSKDFSDNNPAAVSVTLTCTSGTVSPPTAPASEATPATFSVTGFTGAPNCTATEVVPPGYTASQGGCAAVPLSTGACTLVNTLNVAGFTVAKTFSDGSAAAVTVTLTCTSGTVSPPTALASAATPASFTVSGYGGAPTCTATETVPPGYSANQAGCAGVALSAGTCTIANTALPSSISIVLTANTGPSPPGMTFAFTASGGLVPTNFSLANGGAQTFSNVAPGSGYGVTVTVPAGFVLVSATCSDGSSPSNIDLALGETISCSFVIRSLAAGGTATAVSIPLLDERGLIALILALALLAGVALRRRRR